MDATICEFSGRYRTFAPIPLGPAIAYYTIMDRCSTRVRVAISVVLLYGIVRSQMLPGHNEPYDFFVALLQLAVAGIRLFDAWRRCH